MSKPSIAKAFFGHPEAKPKDLFECIIFLLLSSCIHVILSEAKNLFDFLIFWEVEEVQ